MTMTAYGPAGATGPTVLEQIMIRLADEGVPIRAIARSVKVPSDELRDILRDALDSGTIVQLPRDDWPSKASRDERPQGFDALSNLDEELLLLYCVQVFKITRLMSCLLLALLKRREVTRDAMHQIIEQRRPANQPETDKKMVDVVVCNLRKRLKLLKLEITTIWSCGYYMKAEHRGIALKMLTDFIANGPPPAATPNLN